VLSIQLDDHRSLRLLEESDVDELHSVVAENRDYLARWMPWASGQTPRATLEFIQASRKQLGANQGFQVAIVDGGKIVGSAGFHGIDWANMSTSIGYWIAQSHQRRGTVTAAVRSLVDYAFEIWRLNRIEIRAAVGNHRSRAIPSRLGFKEEGVLRQSERVGDRFVDHVVYSVLADEWAQRSG
jgi:ribosomal-protein-serine acetyltransferase